MPSHPDLERDMHTTQFSPHVHTLRSEYIHDWPLRLSFVVDLYRSPHMAYCYTVYTIYRMTSYLYRSPHTVHCYTMYRITSYWHSPRLVLSHQHQHPVVPVPLKDGHAHWPSGRESSGPTKHTRSLTTTLPAYITLLNLTTHITDSGSIPVLTVMSGHWTISG